MKKIFAKIFIKKTFIMITSAALALLMAILIVPQSLSAKADAASGETALPAVTESEIKTIFTDFITANENRYSYNLDAKGGELIAAQYIAGKLTDMGYSQEQVFIDDFSREFPVSSGYIFGTETETSHSQNVVLRLPAADAGVKKRLVIGCDYDNIYESTNRSAGAIDNASGVAVVLGLARNLFEAQLAVNIDIVFFGAGYYEYGGSEAYIEKHGLTNVAAMINVTRVAMSDVYLYCEELATPLEDFILGADSFIKKMPSNVLLLNREYIMGYPYMHIGMSGNHSQFLSRGIPVANIFGGDSSILNLRWNIEKDTVLNMEKEYAGCYKNMASTCALLTSLAASADGLVATAGKSKSSVGSPLTKRWIALILFTALALSLFLCLRFLSRYYIRKYPIASQRKVLPVFGSEYE